MSDSEFGNTVPANDLVIGISDPQVGISDGPGGDVGFDSGTPPVGNVTLGWDPLAEMTHVTIMEGCNCPACQGMRMAKGGTDDTGGKGDANGGGGGDDPTSANGANGNTGVVLPLGTNPDGSHFFTGVRNIDATLIGSKWGGLNLTYSFPTSGSNYNGSVPLSAGVDNYHIDLGSQQQAAARAAFTQLSALTGLKFTEIAETDTLHANIRISQTADSDVGSAYGGFPSDKQSAAGDIWFGRTNQPYYDLAFKGTWGYATMFHEIGHTMGLKHGHQDYTNSDLSFYFGTSPRFGTQSLTADRDGQAWSLMTYTPAPGYANLFAGDKVNQPQGYMQYDLAALQYLYGANYNTNADDTVYTFSQTTGEMFVNGVGQGAPSGNKIFLTVWDGGGNDTIDVSNYANGVTVDLRPGEFSTFDQAQLANNLAYQNLTVLAPGNIAMSLLYNNDARSLIENVKGGTGNDIFIGNTANNVLDGGAGSDTVIFTNTTGVNVTLNDTGADVIVTHDGETDTLRSIENIQGTVGNDTLTGNSQNNTLSGGAGGADTLSGGAGDDRLIGGGFTTTTTLSAPSQPDITKPQTTNNGSIATAVTLAGAYDVDANVNITSSTTIPHATINATAAGGSVEYYRIDVTVAGSQAIFDIDGTGTLDDSILELVNTAGTVLATNDTGPGDPGTTTGDDAYITYTFATAGTYYIRVGRYISSSVAQPLLAGQTYQLNVSLQNAATVTATTVANNTSSLIADGGEGNDFVAGTIGNDTLVGGAGNDTVSFATAFSTTAAGITFNLNQQGTAQNTGAAGTDTITGFENVIGSQYNDMITGNADANVIEGGLGNDTLVGGAGNDTASYAGASAGVTVSLALQGTAQNTGVTGTDTLTGFQNLQGSAFNDTLTGDAAENTLTGGAGDDTLNPGANGAGTVDLLDGGTGSDTASFAGYTAGVTATLTGLADGTASVGGQQIAALRSIENLTGGDGNDTLTGDANANVIEGGLGDDILDGGQGVDTVSFRGTTATTVNLSILTAQATGYGNDTILNFENVRTGSGNDTITGDGNDNIFFDGGGADTYNGAAGSDTVDYTNIAAALTVNLNTTTAQSASTGGDILSGIENVNGSLTAANTLTGGNDTANRLVGGALADFIIGGGLGDTLIGGAGNDVIFGDYVNTFNTTAGIADGDDVIEGGAGSDSLVGGMGNDILRGGDGDDLLVGGIANGTAAGLTAVYTNDGGDDTFDGGDGTDTAYAYYTDHTGGIAFDLRSLAGNSVITSGGAVSGAFISIERVIFRGGSGNDVVHGGGTLDTLVGNAGDDVLDGWFGNDTLSGGLGNDMLIGGEGLDTATYVNSTAGVTVDLRIQDVAQDTGGEGIDTLSGIEYLTGSAFGDTLRGNDDFNLIIDNAVTGTATAGSQTDSLFGYGGNDSILVTRATGTVATNVNMDGGDGDDLIQLLSGTATTTTTDPDGLSSGATYVLPGYSGTRFLDNVTVNAGTGNDRVVLTGVDAAVVDLGTGNDVLSISTLGGVGFNDYDITTGAGQDTIQLAGSGAAATTTARATVVRDFTVGDAGDRFELRTVANGTFAATSWVNTTNFTGLTSLTQDMFDTGYLRLLQDGTDLLLQSDRDGTGAASMFVTIARLSNTYTGGFTAFNFDGMIGSLTLTGIGALNETLTGGSKADTLSGGDGNDVLIGLAGNDTLDGGNGDDLLNGGVGDDTLIGGAGTDTATYADATVGVTVNLSVTGAQTTGAGSDTLSGIENLIGSAFGDTLTGDAGANRLEGGAGNDTLSGGAGDDTLVGGAGDDTLIGGAGIDTATYADATVGVTVNLGLAGAQVTGVGSDTLSGIENLVGSSFNDVLTGDAGNNRIDAGGGNDTVAGGAGDDVLIGGDGIDTLSYADMTSTVLINLTDGQVNAGAQGGIDQVSGFENVILGSGDDIFIGDAGDNMVEGGAGDDIIRGLAGNDTIRGGDGNDTIDGGEGDDVLAGGAGTNAVNGGAGNDIGVLQQSSNQYFINRTSATTATFTSSDNTEVTNFSNVESYRFADGTTILLGTDGVMLNGDANDNLLIGGGGNDTLNGGAGNDTLSGGAGNDTLNGGDGDDVLAGGTGTNFVNGGAGNDIGVLQQNSDQYFINRTSETTVTFTSNDNTEVTNFSDVESYRFADGTTIVLGTDGVTLTGDANNNVLAGGGGNDTLSGGAGNDTLSGGEGSDVLAGGTGTNFVNGGAGNDIGVLQQNSDRYFINSTSETTVTFTSNDNTEVTNFRNVESYRFADGTTIVLGTDGVTLTGDANNNVLAGGGGNDTLSGGDGDDVLAGGTGTNSVRRWCRQRHWRASTKCRSVLHQPYQRDDRDLHE